MLWQDANGAGFEDDGKIDTVLEIENISGSKVEDYREENSSIL